MWNLARRLAMTDPKVRNQIVLCWAIDCGLMFGLGRALSWLAR